MSITFELEARGNAEAINFANTNAAALMKLAGLDPQPFGEVRGEELRACISRLLRAVNSAALRSEATTAGCDEGRWIECARTDEYLQRHGAELLALLVCAQRHDCAVVWG
jgi:hypothetical protein